LEIKGHIEALAGLLEERKDKQTDGYLRIASGAG